MVGVLPSELSSISSIKEIHFYGNNINGTVPEQIFDLALEIFDIENNKLSGQIFPEIKLSSLKNTLSQFLVSHNTFTGTIPSRIGELTALTRFWVGSNKLSGSIPKQLANLTRLGKT